MNHSMSRDNKMKIIIAPSKTMKYTPHNISGEPILFKEENQYLYDIIKQYNDEQLSQLMKISSKQSQIVYDYFHNDYPLHPAIALYQGHVFKQLHLDKYHLHHDYLTSHLCIMSAYYGILHYNTLISPYRLDMTMKINHINLYEYWYTKVYQYFENEDYIISLSSHEFTSMIRHPHIYFIDFVENCNGQLKRNSMNIKKARGMMLDYLVLNEITDIEEIKSINIDGYSYNSDMSQNYNLVFIKEK